MIDKKPGMTDKPSPPVVVRRATLPSPAADRPRGTQPPRALLPHAYRYGVALLVLSLVAFWPVYFARLTEVRLAIHLHVVLAFAWVGLLIAQSWLARQKRFQRHRAVGALSYLVAPLFIVFSVALFHDMLSADTPFSRQFGARIAFYDLSGLLYFTVAYGLAISVYRKAMPIHARLMLSTIVLMLFPVIGRLLLFYVDLGLSPGQALTLSLYIVDAIVLLLVVVEWRRGTLYPVFPVLFGYTVLQHVGYAHADGWALWQAFVTWFAAL